MAARLVLLALLIALLALLLALLSRACHERAAHSERGGRARAGARAGRVAPNAECARAALVGTVCRAALLFVARLNATRGPLDFGSLGRGPNESVFGSGRLPHYV